MALQPFDMVFANHDRVKLCSVTLGASALAAAGNCVCDAGFEGEFSLDLGELVYCEACIAGKYKSGVGFDSANAWTQWQFCTACGAGKTTLAGAQTVSECVCASGYEKIDEVCTLCDYGKFKSYAGNSDCLSCFAHANTSMLGALDVNTCQCVAGYSPVASPSTYDSTCVACDTTSYKDLDGMFECTPCRVNAQTNGAAVSAVECLCSAGFYDVGGVCVACQKGYYKTDVGNHACVPCAGVASGVETTVGTGHVSEDACVCAVGAGFLPTSTEFADTCTNCPVHTYQNGEANVACNDCSSTQYGAQDGAVTTCVNCPIDSLRVGVNADVTDCYCNMGFAYEATSGTCQACAPGTYKADVSNTACETCNAGKFSDADASILCDSCPEHANSPTGSTSSLACLCNAGYHPVVDACIPCADGYIKNTSGNVPCTPCVEGTFSSDTLVCTSCQQHATTTGDASISIADCQCVAGFQESSTDVNICEQCEAGFYCPGQDLKVQCHTHSMSLPGSEIASACICLEGYYEFSSSNCANCPAGSFCFDNMQYTCPPPSTSPANSATEAACVCNAGYESVAAR